MEKVIKIGKQSVKLNNNVAWTMEYRDQFGKDVVQDHIPVLSSITEGIAAVMNEAGTSEDLSVENILNAVEGRTLELMLPLMQTEAMTTIINITWAMAKAADESIDPPKQWVRQFDEFPLDVVVPAIYELALKGFVSSKNWKRLMSLKKSIKTIQPSRSTQSSSQDSSEA